MSVVPALTLLVHVLSLHQAQLPPATTDPQGPKAPPPRVVDPSVPPTVTVPGPDHPNAEVTNAPLTADEAARIALRLQPSLGVPQGTIEAARGRVRQTAAGLYPQVIAGVGYNSIQSLSGSTAVQSPTGVTPAGVSPTYPYSSAVEVRQLLFDFNQTRNLVRQNEALQAQAETNLTRAQQDLVLQVKDAFYNYANAQRLVNVNDQNVQNRQRQLDLANARLRHGIGLPSDVVTAETSKTQAVLALNLARDQAEQARVSLLQAMGVDPLTPVVPADAPEKPIPTPDSKVLIQRALETRPEVKAAEQELRASNYGLSAAKSLNLPSIYAEVAAGAAGDQFPLKNNATSVGVGLQFPIFDAGQRAGAVQTARGQVTVALSDFRTAVLGVRSDVTSALLELESAEQRVALADAEVANAQEGVRVAEGRYAAGLGLFLDITTAQSLLLTAQTDRTTVQNALDQARARLRHAMGETFAP